MIRYVTITMVLSAQKLFLFLKQSCYSLEEKNTLKDVELSILKATIINGWLENKKQLNSGIHILDQLELIAPVPGHSLLVSFIDEIFHFDELMLKGEK